MGLVPGIKELMQEYPEAIMVPIDVATDVEKKRKEIAVSRLPTDYAIYEIGTETAKKYGGVIRKAESIVISGPMGVFENKEFMMGTRRIFQAVAASKAFSLVGGGHRVAAVGELGLADKMSYISTAGGALIEFLMGKQLSGVVAWRRQPPEPNFPTFFSITRSARITVVTISFEKVYH